MSKKKKSTTGSKKRGKKLTKPPHYTSCSLTENLDLYRSVLADGGAWLAEYHLRGKPVPKERPRFQRWTGRVYDPPGAKVKKASFLSVCAQQGIPSTILKGALSMLLVFEVP